MQEAVEWEIKLLAAEELDPAAVAEAARGAGYGVEAAGERAQADAYLDSARMDLAREGAGLRIRRIGDESRVTFKAAGKRKGAVYRRAEIEGPWEPGGLPRSARSLPAAIRRQVEPLIFSRPLRKVAEIDNRRALMLLTDAETGARAELVVDAVATRSGRRGPFNFAELEIEALEGDTAPWPRLAESLRGHFGLETSTVNKLERGLSLAGVEAPAPRAVEPLSHKTPFQEAAVRIFRKHFLTLQRNEPGTRLAEDIECLHDMRVSSRRLRAAFRLLAGAFPPGALEPHLALMADTGQRLGHARDLDVFMEELPGLKALIPAIVADDLIPFEEQLQRYRAAEQEQLLAWASSPKRLKAMQRFEELVEGAGSGDQHLGVTVGQIAPGLVLHTARKVYARGAKIKKNSPAERIHRLRISFKKMRYALEDFSDLYGENLKGFIKSCKGLQDVLGAFNDADVGLHWLQSWVDEHGQELPRRTLLAIGSLLGVLATRREQIRADFRQAYKSFDKDSVRRELHAALIEHI